MKVRKFTRRQLAGAIAGAAVVGGGAAARVQASPAGGSAALPGQAADAAEDTPVDLLKQAAAKNQANAQALAKAAPPMATEPSVVFRTL